ncbi:hypothetical protein AU184_26360 [Mycolicibacterium novocastrense]|uniref:VOC family protein n=1 Tax=Mycolicibacterium novocastrense TaxID=59813 RepID=UPI00074A75DC|nr:VOC family protein [Mycolicibacterium novocastrense]KUH67476.1 hypothetical protein AU183_00095 [Mycolicibacterium novocastrense]KUH68196.1 hypothetical protein AU184_26360 [Mycolicibacterium novocastrense]KUH74392.1 hypothetical protein AU072_17385 [Mycolicibacterium novocastrense]
MTTQPYRGAHYALLVRSIEETRDTLRRNFGVEFGAVATIPLTVRGHRDEFALDVRACYAKDRHVELVQAADRGPFARSLQYGLHHFGGVVDDLKQAVEEQLSQGNTVEWELSYDDKLVAVFFTGAPCLPGRLELVNGNNPPLFDMFAEDS